jgi:hypothetical protein
LSKADGRRKPYSTSAFLARVVAGMHAPDLRSMVTWLSSMKQHIILREIAQQRIGRVAGAPAVKIAAE